MATQQQRKKPWLPDGSGVYIVKELDRLYHSGHDLLIVYGKNHVIVQEKAIRAFVERK